MKVIEISGLCKSYPGFLLKDVSFSLREGRIMGFIGRNGAGKTTTLKALTDLVHPDGGEISFFGKRFSENEFEIKQRIGFVSGGIDYYPKKKLSTITAVTRSFYDRWDGNTYSRLMKQFGIAENKTPSELSAGMKVKYSLALALSHNAELLILDEPTSGLDPVSRDEILDIFLSMEDRGKSILFSTHITSDLEKCADDITYIKNGRVIASKGLAEFTEEYRVAELSGDGGDDSLLIGKKRAKNGYTALVKAADAGGFTSRAATLEDIMVHMEHEGGEEL